MTRGRRRQPAGAAPPTSDAVHAGELRPATRSVNVAQPGTVRQYAGMASVAPRRGMAPYGWRWERGSLIPVEHEQHVRWLILHMQRRGYSLARIAGELHALNIATRDGGEAWPKTTLHRIVSTAATLENTG